MYKKFGSEGAGLFLVSLLNSFVSFLSNTFWYGPCKLGEKFPLTAVKAYYRFYKN